jgi:LuxR family maltose regulon positive regulatory protein
LAKLSRPRLAGVCTRERLFLRLDECLQHAALWVSGGAGMGKTSLVASYLDARKLSSLWYQVDGGDTDPAVCCTDLTRLLVTAAPVKPRRDRELPALALPQTANRRAASQQFFDAFYAGISGSRVLVLSNCQEAISSLAFRELLLAAIRQRPQHIGLIITSRSRPPSVFARLRASAELAVIGADELLFTEDESIAVQQQTAFASRTRTLDQMRALHQFTGGWPVGLKLLQHLEDPDALVVGGGRLAVGTAVLDYMAAEVFDQQPENVRHLLLKLAFLPRMTPAMAAALSGDPAAAAILEDMHGDGNFTVAHGVGANCHYEFHPLLREFLLLRAGTDFTAEQRHALAHEAATLLEEGGDIDAAAQVLVSASAWDGLQRLLLVHAKSLLDRGCHQTLAAWLAAFPETRLANDPWLSYWHGAALQPFDPPAAETRFLGAYQLFRELQISGGAVLTWSAIVDLICLEWADFSKLDRWLGEADGLRNKFGITGDQLAARFAASMFSALLFRRPQDPALHQWAERLLLLIEACPDHSQRILLGCNLQMHFTVGVGFNDKLERLMKAIDPPAGTALTALSASLLWALKSMYHWSRGRSAEAASAAESGSRLARQNGVRMWDVLLGALQVYAWLNSGELSRARAALAQLEKSIDPKRKLEVAHYHYLACLVSLLADDGAQAMTQIETANALARHYGGPQQNALGSFALAQALHAVDRTGEAWPALEQGREIGRSMSSDILCFQGHLCEALFALDEGNDERCASALQHAFALGAERDYLNHTSFRPAGMERLCAFALAQGIVPEYARRLIRLRCLKPPSPEVECWPWPVRIYTLGRFSVVVDGQPVAEAGRLSQKPIELLQALIAHGGRQIALPLLIDTLWSEAESKGGRGAFESTLSRLRRLLVHDDSILLERGRLTLNPARCWVDIWSFERLLNQVQAALHDVAQPDLAALRNQTDRALHIYQGDFLGREECHAWALPMQERLRNRLVNALADVGRRLEASELWDEAVGLYRRAIELEPLAETWYQRLMGCLDKQGETAAALSVYFRCSDALRTGLRTGPSRETEALRVSLDRLPTFQHRPGV